MRIYVHSNAHIKKNLLTKLEPYLHDTREICYIWTEGGLLQLEKDKLYKVKIQDVLAKKTLLGAFPATIDESELLKQEECFQISPRSYKEKITLKVYKQAQAPAAQAQAPAAQAQAQAPAAQAQAQAPAAVEWILEYKDNKLHDNYFSLPAGEDIHSPKNKADILQFINL